MQRYFINKSQINNNIVTIIGDDVYHIKKVMRMNVSDKVTVSDNESLYECIITSINENNVQLEIIKEIKVNSEIGKNISFAHGLVRKEKMEEVIDYLTELGACSYQPVIMEKSVVKITKEDFNKKIDRLNKIAKEASEQSLRNKLLEVKELITFNELINNIKNYDCVLVCDTNQELNKKLSDVYYNDNYHNILIVIGPESGFSEKELAKLYDNGCFAITLGKRILRTQVAPIYVMSVIGHLDGDK